MHQEADRLHSFSRRALVVGGVQVAAFAGLAARLWQLQVEEGSSYALLAEDNRINQRLFAPPRGRILDIRGVEIAGNTPTYRVRVVREQAKDLRRVLEELAQIIVLVPRQLDEVEQQARVLRPFVPVTVREDLSWEEVTRIAVRSPELPGVLLDSGLLRRYPLGVIMAHILGYVGPPSEFELKHDPDPILSLPDLRIGKNGVEKAYDRELRGRAGVSRIEVNAVGREIREVDRDDGLEGADLQVSIDAELQAYAMQRLGEHQAAASVILDVESGAVLAMASVPSFDPHVFTNGLSSRVWHQLRDDPHHPLVNKAIRGEYPPGSTFKMVTALAALEAGVATASSEVHCPGHMKLGNATFHCWRPTGHGRLNMVQALAQSCDVYFYEMARRMGIDTLAAMARRLGLGDTVGLDLPGERPGLIPTAAWKKKRFGVSWQKGETLICGIGQGYINATPLQLAVMTARLCNGGHAVEPWLVRGRLAHVAGGKGEPLPSLGIDQRHLDVVLKGMLEVVNGGRGTARSAQLPFDGVLLGGKTGTSQVVRISKADRLSGAYKRKDRPREERDHALFVCFAPADRPRYAISVIVEHGEGGAKVAAPIARDLMVRTLELDPSGTGIPLYRRTTVAERG